MAISSVGSNSSVQPPVKPAPVEAAEATSGGKDVKNDGDTDDTSGAAAAGTPTPVVNTLGQQIGNNLNVTA
jgi:hypothetical protein